MWGEAGSPRGWAGGLCETRDRDRGRPGADPSLPLPSRDGRGEQGEQPAGLASETPRSCERVSGASFPVLFALRDRISTGSVLFSFSLYYDFSSM